MSLDLLHRRLVVGMGFVALTAFAGGAGFEPISTALARGSSCCDPCITCS